MCSQRDVELTPWQIARLTKVYYATFNPQASVISASQVLIYQSLMDAGWITVTECSPYILKITSTGVDILSKYSRLQCVISLLDEGYFAEAVPFIESLERKDLCELLIYPMALIRKIAAEKMELLS